MIEKVEKLVVALTDLAVQATTYVAKLNGQTPGQAISREAGEQPAPPVEKPPRTRKAKTPEAAPAPAPEPTPAAPAEPSAAVVEQAKAEMTRFATSFVNFDRDAEGVKKRQTQLREYLASAYKATKLMDLTHEQRLALVEWLKTELASMAKTPAPAGLAL